MRIAILTVSLIMVFVSPAFGGEIYGSIELNGRSIGGGLEIEIKCSDAARSTKTDEIGSYRFYTKKSGKCTLKLKYGNEPFPEIEIYSYEGTVRYDLVLESVDGRYRLRRK